jgi:hypothetical protein
MSEVKEVNLVNHEVEAVQVVKDEVKPVEVKDEAVQVVKHEVKPVEVSKEEMTWDKAMEWCKLQNGRALTKEDTASEKSKVVA